MNISDIICRHFPLSKTEFAKYIKTCPFRYKTYPIKKRNGLDERIISQPSKDLKAVQRYVLDEYLMPKLKIHEAATAYRTGSGIIDNAKPHLQNTFLLKMDFKDFFPSIVGEDFVKYLSDNKITANFEDAGILVNLFFKHQNGKLVLSIGSPGSPAISNAILREFDEQVSDLCSLFDVTYTRYSDDITFSTKEKGILFKFPQHVDDILSKLSYPKLQINLEKTVFSSKKFNRHVTGITISNEGKASLGHEKKRILRSRIYQSHSLNEQELASLRGYIVFADYVEPGLLAKLWKKYPKEVARIMF